MSDNNRISELEDMVADLEYEVDALSEMVVDREHDIALLEAREVELEAALENALDEIATLKEVSDEH